MPLYGHELSEEVDPLTAGLHFAVSLEGRTFVGSDSLTQISGRPLSLRRVGLKLTGRRAAREGALVLDSDQRAVGRITSGTFSPSLECPIAMAYLATEAANPGTGISVDVRGTRIDAEIVPMPFYRSQTTSGKSGA